MIPSSWSKKEVWHPDEEVTVVLGVSGYSYEPRVSGFSAVFEEISYQRECGRRVRTFEEATRMQHPFL
jgi:hypothetical protein